MITKSRLKLVSLLLLTCAVLHAPTSSLAVGSEVSCESLYAGDESAVKPERNAKVPEKARKRVSRADVDAISERPEARAMLHQLLDFADKHNLNERIIEVGPPERRLKRLTVALDVRDEALVLDYMQTFNLHKDLNEQPARTLSFEFDKEVVGNYVFGAIRTGSVPQVREGLWRWGATSIDQTADWFVHGQGDPLTHLIGYAHLIPITENEATNVDFFLANPQERGPCKSSNCIAWATGIELGRTALDATPDERKLLFNELGVSRSMAHFEIGRRIAHAANERHVAVVVYYRDEVGLENFKHLENIMPPEPQQPFEDIVKGLMRSKDSPLSLAMAQIPDGAKVYFPIAAGASPEGMSGLIDRAETLPKGVDVHVLVNGVSEAVFKRGLQTPDGKFRVHALFLGGNLRQLHRDGKVDVVPGYLSDFGRHVGNPLMPDFHYDVMVVRVSPPDENGHYSLGPNNDMIKLILRQRPEIKVIAEVNPNVPFTIGDNYLTEKQITAQFPSTSALAGPAKLPVHEPEYNLGRYLAQLIPDGARVQLGIGGVFGGLPREMKTMKRHGIKFFTEMMGDPMMEMMENGVAESAETGFAFGSGELYKFIDRNPRVRILETEVTNDPSRVAAIPMFHAVNTALQVTLRGDVNATHGADGYRMSSPGGQVEFMSGAMRSPGGKAIIAIRSTAKGESMSTISLDTYGGSVTTPNEMVTHVVTEWGIAVMAGQNEAQRAVNMIRVAHPKFRAELANKAVARHLITPAMAAEFHAVH